LDARNKTPSWPGKSAERVFLVVVPAIHVLLCHLSKKDVDARHI
jgi:hypothetical protein